MRGRKLQGSLAVALVLAAAGCGGSAGNPEPTSDTVDPEPSVARQTTIERPTTGRGETRPTVTGQYGSGATVSERCLQEAQRRGEAAVSLQRPPEVPVYEVTGASENGDGLRLQILTSATGRAEFRLIAEELRARNRDYSALSVNFYENTGEGRWNVGTAYVFNTREAACRVFGYSVEQQENIIREGNGIVVVSAAEGI